MHNDQSSITYHQGGAISFEGPDAVAFYAAAVLASSLGLYAKCKMIPTRGVTITVMLAHASKITGKTYKRGDAQKAADDVRLWSREMKAALPQIVQGEG